jgi:hypothetical protein
VEDFLITQREKTIEMARMRYDQKKKVSRKLRAQNSQTLKQLQKDIEKAGIVLFEEWNGHKR